VDALPDMRLWRLDRIVSVALIDGAAHEIDMAAYVLTDWAVTQALTRAADRGVAIRIHLDGTRLAERKPAKVDFRYSNRCDLGFESARDMSLRVRSH
jgi:phosphatidylserine/phosphatidylglycerophosphate/cardiolipin synthase-like enzyme